MGKASEEHEIRVNSDPEVPGQGVFGVCFHAANSDPEVTDVRISISVSEFVTRFDS